MAEWGGGERLMTAKNQIIALWPLHKTWADPGLLQTITAVTGECDHFDEQSFISCALVNTRSMGKSLLQLPA